MQKGKIASQVGHVVQQLIENILEIYFIFLKNISRKISWPSYESSYWLGCLTRKFILAFTIRKANKNDNKARPKYILTSIKIIFIRLNI